MFGNKLKNAVQKTPGCHSAVLMGLDGIPVDFFSSDEKIDIETVGMEFSVILKEVCKTIEILESGAAEELTVRTDRMTTLVRLISDEYFIALLLSPDGNLGKARYVLRILAPEIRQDLV
jgi:predicted regulator of Ras-like GTPase activity (Roadblock/LC7/MglB family)